MKSTLIVFGIGMGIVLVHLTGFFDLFASAYALPASLVLVAVTMLVALKVLGNPLK